MATPNLPPGFDFTDPEIYAHRLPVQELAELRRTAPIWWNEQPPDRGGFGDGGYWVVSKHRDVREVSLRSDVFSSAKKSIVPRYPEELAQGQIEAGRTSMIMMDDPEHSRLRKIIARGFTPRAVERLRADLGERAQRIAQRAAEEGSGDFVLQVAAELPLQAIAGLLGVPPEDRGKLFDWSNQMIGSDDPEFAHYNSLTSAGEMMWYAMQLAARKAEEPGDDIVTTLIQADAEGQRLSEAEFGMFVVTLGDRGQRDDPQLDHAGHDGLHRQPRPVGAVQGATTQDRRRRDHPLGHPDHGVSAHRAGRHRARRCGRSTRASGWCCSTARPTSTKRSSTTRTPSTSCATPTRTSDSAAPGRITALAPTWRA